MTNRWQFHINQNTQPIKTVKRESRDDRMRRLKATADVTGRRFVQVYLEDERKKRGDQC